jgi:hypothetical protein
MRRRTAIGTLARFGVVPAAALVAACAAFTASDTRPESDGGDGRSSPLVDAGSDAQRIELHGSRSSSVRLVAGIDVARPGGIVEGDLLWAYITAVPGTDFFLPEGWSVVGNLASVGCARAATAYWGTRIAGPNESVGQPYRFSAANAANIVAHVVAIGGLEPAATNLLTSARAALEGSSGHEIPFTPSLSRPVAALVAFSTTPDAQEMFWPDTPGFDRVYDGRPHVTLFARVLAGNESLGKVTVQPVPPGCGFAEVELYAPR